MEFTRSHRFLLLLFISLSTILCFPGVASFSNQNNNNNNNRNHRCDDRVSLRLAEDDWYSEAPSSSSSKEEEEEESLPDRRNFLWTVGAAAAGCVGFSSPSSSSAMKIIGGPSANQRAGGLANKIRGILKNMVRGDHL
jgi:hypothetical protein